jgi:hypothetical protein
MKLTHIQRTELIRVCDNYERVVPRPYTFKAELALSTADRKALVDALAAILMFLIREGIDQEGIELTGLYLPIADICAMMIAEPKRFAARDASVAADAIRAVGLLM